MVAGVLNLALKQAKKAQEDIAQIERELDTERLRASAGGGMVVVTVSGMGEILDIKIDPQVVDPNDIEMLQDLVVTAVREALQKAQERHSERMQSVYGGFNLPGLQNLLGGLG